MAHLPERKEKDCLNCGAVVYGRYCHLCGQENVIPKETAWHLVTHFFNDITHFDGKFFRSLKLLLFRPGYLSKEYSRGRRSNFLNPIRMYIFSSAIFFLIMYSLYDAINETRESQPDWENKMKVRVAPMSETNFKDTLTKIVLNDPEFKKEKYLNNLDTVVRNNVQLGFSDDESMYMSRMNWQPYRWIYWKINNWKLPLDSLSRMPDTTFRIRLVSGIKTDTSINLHAFKEHLERRDRRGFFIGDPYPSRGAYDSAVQSGKVKSNWMARQIKYRQIEINKKYNFNSRAIVNAIFNKFFHSLPQVLFVSLPLLALVLMLLYIRRKQFYYVDHVIFIIHFFIFLFMLIMFMFLVEELQTIWSSALLDYLETALVLAIFFYLYKSMRNYYQQGRAKTILKYLLFLFTTFFITLSLFLLFLFFSMFRI